MTTISPSRTNQNWMQRLPEPIIRKMASYLDILEYTRFQSAFRLAFTALTSDSVDSTPDLKAHARTRRVLTSLKQFSKDLEARDKIHWPLTCALDTSNQFDVPFVISREKKLSVFLQDNNNFIYPLGRQIDAHKERRFLGENSTHAVVWERFVKDISESMCLIDLETSEELRLKTIANEELAKKLQSHLPQIRHSFLKAFVCKNFVHTVTKTGEMARFKINLVNKTLECQDVQTLLIQEVSHAYLFKTPNDELFYFESSLPNPQGVVMSKNGKFRQAIVPAQIKSPYSICQNSKYLFCIIKWSATIFGINIKSCSPAGLENIASIRLPDDFGTKIANGTSRLQSDEEFIACSYENPSAPGWTLIVNKIESSMFQRTMVYENIFKGERPIKFHLNEGFISFDTLTHTHVVDLKAPGKAVELPRIPLLPFTRTFLFISPRKMILVCRDEKASVKQPQSNFFLLAADLTKKVS